MKRKLVSVILCGTMVFGMKPVVTGHHFLQPQTSLSLDGGKACGGNHGNLLSAIGVTVDKWVILNFGHWLILHTIGISTESLAECQCLGFCTEEHGGKTVLHFPDVTDFVVRDQYQAVTSALEKVGTFILSTGEFLWV